MKEIRFHGRGGQGVVKSVQLIVQAIVDDGGYAHFIPSFGVERKGSPVHGFLRISDEDILSKSQITNPDAVVLYDDSLIKMPATLSGLKQDGIILINTSHTVEKLLEQNEELRGFENIYTLPATKIAVETIHKDIPNTTMLGAYAKVFNNVNWEILQESIKNLFGEANVEAAKKGYDAVKQAEVVVND